MYAQKASYLLPILILSLGFVISVTLAIIFCLKRKAKYLFIIVPAFVVVAVLSCVVIKFTPPTKMPENEPAVLNRLTPENLRYTKDYFDHYMSKGTNITDKSEAKLFEFDYTYSKITDYFNLTFTVLSGDNPTSKTIYGQRTEYAQNNVFIEGIPYPYDITKEQYEALPSVTEFETIAEYLSMIRFSDILPEDYSTLSIIYNADRKLTSLENANGYYMLDPAGFHKISQSEIPDESEYVHILIAADNNIYAVYATRRIQK